MNNFEKVYAIQVILEDLSTHPICAHGPTLLFRRKIDKNGTTRDFFACSAYRDRKGCPFFKWADEYKMTNDKNSLREEQLLSELNHDEYFSMLKKIRDAQPLLRAYCFTCNQFFIKPSKDHAQHNVKYNISTNELNHPMSLLMPLSNNKKEAQYLFTQQSVKDITDIAFKLGYCNFLCIGTPLINEYIINKNDKAYSSLLLDIDTRFHSFYGPSEFIWYNSFNHHFFHPEDKTVFEDFLKIDGGTKTCVFMDPPFGGRLEPLSQTLKIMSETWLTLNGQEKSEGIKIPVFLIMPYFMESLIKANMPEMNMSDYKVSYINHSKFNDKKSKQGSIVRFFTNIELSKVILPSTDYKFCKLCDYWVLKENSHCKKCNSCTSKDGRTYVHCNICNRCVKPTWTHCELCSKCCLPDHKCDNNDQSIRTEHKNTKRAKNVTRQKIPNKFSKKQK